MGKKSQTKGKVGEREFANLMNGRRVPASGAMRFQGKNSNDVTLPNGWEAEVKRMASGNVTMYNWLLDNVERPDIVAFRSDGNPWFVAMHHKRFRSLMMIHIAAQDAYNMLDSTEPDSAKKAAQLLLSALEGSERWTLETWQNKDKQ